MNKLTSAITKEHIEIAYTQAYHQAVGAFLTEVNKVNPNVVIDIDEWLLNHTRVRVGNCSYLTYSVTSQDIKQQGKLKLDPEGLPIELRMLILWIKRPELVDEYRASTYYRYTVPITTEYTNLTPEVLVEQILALAEKRLKKQVAATKANYTVGSL